MYYFRISNGSKFLILSIVVLILPIGSSFYKYYYTKNYDYLIEARCNPSIEQCFSRDCSIPDECPPNALSDYKQYYVKAYDFLHCSDNSCEKECVEGLIKCTPILCGQSVDDICTISPL